MVIAAGGDGSLNYLVDKLIKYKYDLSSIFFGVLPLGTGNDFSRACGKFILFYIFNNLK
jgi:diacylglycerol kinase family enzyme